MSLPLDAPLEVVADWLEERGDRRAPLLRQLIHGRLSLWVWDRSRNEDVHSNPPPTPPSYFEFETAFYLASSSCLGLKEGPVELPEQFDEVWESIRQHHARMHPIRTLNGVSIRGSTIQIVRERLLTWSTASVVKWKEWTAKDCAKANRFLNRYFLDDISQIGSIKSRPSPFEIIQEELDGTLRLESHSESRDEVSEVKANEFRANEFRANEVEALRENLNDYYMWLLKKPSQRSFERNRDQSHRP